MKLSDKRILLQKATIKRNGRDTISCKRVLSLADSFNISPARIGKMCDDQHIKITKCKLGCFE
jgi:hypothetical protein